jgi:hypothetical protein
MMRLHDLTSNSVVSGEVKKISGDAQELPNECLRDCRCWSLFQSFWVMQYNGNGPTPKPGTEGRSVGQEANIICTMCVSCVIWGKKKDVDSNPKIAA